MHGSSWLSTTARDAYAGARYAVAPGRTAEPPVLQPTRPPEDVATEARGATSRADVKGVTRLMPVKPILFMFSEL